MPSSGKPEKPDNNGDHESGCVKHGKPDFPRTVHDEAFSTFHRRPYFLPSCPSPSIAMMRSYSRFFASEMSV